MAPKYRLSYFNMRGLAEVIRYLLAYMEEDYEDVRIDRELEWPKIKDKTPFGKLPVLEENGKPLTQSLAIARYLGKKAGLGGKDEWEDLHIDIIAETFGDIRQHLYSIFHETNEETKKEKKCTFNKETLPFYLNKMDDIVKKNGGYLANKKLSWVDFYYACFIEGLSPFTDLPDITVNYPNLHDLKDKIFNLPQIKKWIAKRPVTEY